MTPRKVQLPLRKTLRQESKGIPHKHVRKIEAIRRPTVSRYDEHLREDQVVHEIRLVHNSTVYDLEHEEEERQIDVAHEAADRLIEMAGFDSEDSDHFGAQMGSVVHSALSIALMRCPQLAERIMGYADDIQIIEEAV